MKRSRSLVFALVAVLVIIVVLQNTQSVGARILLVTLSTPRAALLLVTLLVGVGLGMQKGLRETDPRRPHFLRDASDHASGIALSFFVASIQTLLAKGDTLQRESTNNVVFALSLQSPRSQEA